MVDDYRAGDRRAAGSPDDAPTGLGGADGSATDATEPRSADVATEPRSAVSGTGSSRVVQRPRTLWSLAVLAMALDIVLTGVGLSLGLVERNVIARAFIDAIGLLGAGVLLKGAVLAFGYACWRLVPRLGPDAGRYRYLVPLGVAAPSLAAVGINAATILAVL